MRWEPSSATTWATPPGSLKPEDTANQRNGKSGKTVLTEDGPLRIDVPRDRDGSFEPISDGRGSRLSASC